MSGMANCKLDIGMAGSGGLLKRGQIKRPTLSENTAVELIEKLYGVNVKHITQENSYIDRNYRIEVENTWSNHYIEELWPHGYLFKVLNDVDSQNNHADAEHEAAHILTKAGISCPIPVLNIHGKEKSLEKIYDTSSKDSESYTNNKSRDQNWHICRLMRFVPGKILQSVSYTPTLLYETGLYTARIHTALQEFDHKDLHNLETIWNISSVPELKEFVFAVRNDEDRKLINEIIDTYTTDVVPLYSNFRKGFIHGDISEQNSVVQEKRGQDGLPTDETEHNISGILDFGLCTYSYLVFDIAIAITYTSIDSKIVDPLLVGGHVLAGYLSKCTLNESEFEALKVCVAGRYAQSLTMGEYSYSLDPGNDYVIVTAKNGWPQLKKLWATPKEELYKQWREIILGYKKYDR